MNGEDHRGEGEALAGAGSPGGEMIEQPHQAPEIESQQRRVVNAEERFVPVLRRDPHDRIERGRGAGGVGQPIRSEFPAGRPGQAVQEILVLVRVIERGLRVGQCERRRPEKYHRDRTGVGHANATLVGPERR